MKNNFPAIENKTDLKDKAGRIENEIRETVASAEADGVVTGLSGGMDSAVLTTLAVRAVGKEKVKAYYLFDRDSSEQCRRGAELLAGHLGIEFNTRDITGEMEKRGIYTPVVIKFLNFSGVINRILSRLVWDEPFFILTLRRGYSDEGRIKKFVYEHIISRIEQSFNARHIFRREYLEQRAKERNLLLAGGANRTERMLGWFVKGGIDDVAFSPLSAAYKTEVAKLAKYLNLPGEIVTAQPSPDMLKGITDETALGLDYGSIDSILRYIDRGLSDEEIVAKGINKADLELVRRMNRLSEWKRH